MGKATVRSFDDDGREVDRWDDVGVSCRGGEITLRRYRSSTVVYGPVAGVIRSEITGGRGRNWLVTFDTGWTFTVDKTKCNCGAAR